MIFPRRRSAPQPPDTRPGREGSDAAPFTGRDPDGEPTGFDPTGSGRAALLFLTTSCEGCLPLWAGAARDAPAGLTVVTPDPETDSRRRARQLAGRATVVMSSEAWHRYGVTGSPWLVVLADAVVVRDGPAPSGWPELMATASGQASLDC